MSLGHDSKQRQETSIKSALAQIFSIPSHTRSVSEIAPNSPNREEQWALIGLLQRLSFLFVSGPMHSFCLGETSTYQRKAENMSRGRRRLRSYQS